MRPRGRVLRIGETLDRYRIEALIGQGGMAAVYRARHLQLGSEHAIKVLFVTSPQLRERMFREGQVQARLRHPNIVQVTDVLLIQGAPALVMEYVDGPALDSWLLENRPTLEEALFLFRGILRGVSAAHDGEVVHRDLKPANVLLAPTHDGLVPKVTDFGLVKSVSETAKNSGGRAATQSGMALGTPEYMSPEQIRDASDVDQRTDMWALGCILYELVCHRRAFTGPDKMTIFNLIVAGQYDPPRTFAPDLPRNVSEAIRTLLEIDPEKRLPRCQDLHDLLYQEQELRVGRLGAPNRPSQRLLAESPAHEITIPPDDTFTTGTTSPTSPSQLANAPTGAPATRRVAGPMGLSERGPARIVTQDSEPRPRTPLLIPGLLAIIGLLGVGATGAFLIGRNEGAEAGLTVVPRPEQLVPPTRPAPPPVEPPPPGPVSPTSVVPDPEAPVVPKPGPRPEGPRPAPAPAPKPAGGGSFSVTGDAATVWLVSAAGKFSPGAVAEGRYDVLADFGDGSPVPAGNVTLSSGQQVVLRCSSKLQMCRPAQ